MNINRFLPLLLCSPLLIAGCGKFNLDKVTYTVTPNPLEYRNDSVAVTIKADYPKKTIPKKGHAVLTPSLEFNGQSVDFQPLKVKGEKSKTGDGQTLNHKTGGSVSYNGVVQYKDGMQKSELFVKAKGYTANKKGEKERFDGKTPNAIAQGVIITPLLAYVETANMTQGKHNYGPIFKTNTSVLYFAYNSKEVRGVEKKSEDMTAFRSFVDKQTKDSSTFKNMDVLGYASPEGKADLNQTLSGGRSDNFAKYLKDETKKANKQTTASNNLKTEAKGADFAGFEQKLSEKAGSEKSKVSQLVKNGVSNAELKKQLDGSLAKEIEKEVLSPLRRAEVITTVELKPKTEAQLKSLAVSDPAALTLEELLYTSQTLITDEKTRLSINQSAEKVNPSDWRAYNNAAVSAATQGQWDVAEDELRKAEKVAPSEKIVLSNLGKVYWQKGDRKKSEEYFDKAAGFADADQAKGTILILRGKYNDAVAKFGNVNSFNAALAKLLAGRPGEVDATLDGGADKDKALSSYLKAIAASRQGNKEKVLSNLKTAISKDASLRAKAKDDAEFIKYRTDSDFSSL
jgi:tetratricopeptide (TPR) repeat protein